MRYRRVKRGASPVKVKTTREAVSELVARGRRAISDYYDHKYTLYKEIYENGCV